MDSAAGMPHVVPANSPQHGVRQNLRARSKTVVPAISLYFRANVSGASSSKLARSNSPRARAPRRQMGSSTWCSRRQAKKATASRKSAALSASSYQMPCQPSSLASATTTTELVALSRYLSPPCVMAYVR
jgi:hypothetical protein